MIETRLLQPVTPADLVTVTRLHDDVEAVDGHPSLGEAVWRDLDEPLEPVSAGILATDDGRPVGFAYVYRSDSFSPPHWAAGMVVHPDVRGSTGVEVALLERAVEHVAAAGGGLVVLWVFEPDPLDDEAAARAGFRHQRDLLQERVPLPLGEEPAWPPGRRGAVLRARAGRPHLADRQQPGVRRSPRAGRLGAGDARAAHGRALVRPEGLPARLRRRRAGRVLLDEGPPRDRTPIPSSARSS